MLRRLAAFTVLVTPLLAPATAHSEEMLDYVVGPGENCESISAKVFGDPQAFPILHTLNPQLGPTPHNLKPGTVLKVPKPGPDAHLTFLRNKVEAATPSPHPGAKNEPLLRGHKVSTQQESSAELTFKDQTRLQLGSETLVIVLGATYTNAAKKSAADTTLLKGSLRATSASSPGKSRPRSRRPGRRSTCRPERRSCTSTTPRPRVSRSTPARASSPPLASPSTCRRGSDPRPCSARRRRRQAVARAAVVDAPLPTDGDHDERRARPRRRRGGTVRGR
ncbi:MAG: LysM peptidoglycan-binding domain-containing protein [Myxococcales bacterium]|nr:LysM peptidoglycan-binding domain-containing protein [Myxococcales bacterium]